MSVSLAPYQHSPRPKGDVFRYFVLQPGVGDQPLKCGLRIAYMADFEALVLCF